MHRKDVAFAFALCFLASVPAVAAEQRYEVSLVTMYPGDELFTGFGHIALRVHDRETGDDTAFDYGTYDAEDPYLAFKFLVGTLPYYCTQTPYSHMVDWYSQDFGGILLQRLDFNDEQASVLLSRMTHDCLPENAAYRYHHFDNNCATRLRDLLDEVLGGALGAATKTAQAPRTLRELIDASMSRWQYAFNRWIVFGLLNGTIDLPANRWQQMFLPFYLSQELDRLQLHKPGGTGPTPLVLHREIVLGNEKREPDNPSMLPGAVFLLLLLALSLVPLALRNLSTAGADIAAGTLTFLFGLVGGLYGLLLAFTWAVSPYPETKWNWTLLLFHPAHLFLVPWGAGVVRSTLRTALHRTALAPIAPSTPLGADHRPLGFAEDRPSSIVHRPSSSPAAPSWLRLYLLVGVAVSLLALALGLTGLVTQRLWPYALATLAASAGLSLSLRPPSTPQP